MGNCFTKDAVVEQPKNKGQQNATTATGATTASPRQPNGSVPESPTEPAASNTAAAANATGSATAAGSGSKPVAVIKNKTAFKPPASNTEMTKKEKTGWAAPPGIQDFNNQSSQEVTAAEPDRGRREMPTGKEKRDSKRGGSPGIQARTPATTHRTVSPVPERKANATFDDVYTRGKQLGSGAFAKVFIAVDKQTKENYAVKEIDRSKMHWGGRDALQDEINNLRKLVEAPNVVKFQDVFEQKDICFLVLELLPGGELFNHIIQKGIFTEAEARDSCRCILMALDYMHSRRMVHRDLKPENLLLTGNMDLRNVKLSDFGFSKTLPKKNSLRTLCGTPGYLAPEILERWPSYDVSCDIFSFGVIMFLLLGGYLPFDPHGSNNINQVFEATRNGKYHFYPQRWKEISFQAKDLVAKCLTTTPARRISSKKALEHDWMSAGELKLPNTQISAVSLRNTVVKAEKAKKEADEKGRLEELNDDFTVFLDQRKGDSIVSHMTGTARTVATQATQFREDSPTGKPFSDFYKLGEALGEGGFAQVYRCTHKKTGLTYAVKDVNTEGLTKQELSTLKDEIVVLKYLRGAPFIVRLYDVFQEPNRTYMVLEEMKGGDLLTRICEKEVYTELEARELCQYFFEAVAYCHQKNIAHRDIKLDNLLLMEEGNDASIKLADFGFAKRMKREKSLKTLCGTPNYMAPEIFNLDIPFYDYRCDMWSVGVVVYALVGGYLPFEGSLREIAKLVVNGEYYFHEEYWTDITKEARDMIVGLLQTDVEKRLSAHDALACKWMGLDDEQLSVIDLSTTQNKLHSLSSGKEMLKNAVKAIIGANKMASVAGFKKEFGTDGLSSIAETAEEPEEKSFEEMYDIGNEIGDGVYGKVYMATNRANNTQYSAKRVVRRTLHPSDVAAVNDEIEVLREVSGCPQIITLFQVYEDPDITTIVMEHFDGQPLIDRLIESKTLTEFYAKEVVQNLMLGVAYCHKRRIANRNLKLDNILLPHNSKSGSDVKICDFEFARKLNFPNSLKTQCGTQEYVAPEVLENKPAYDVPCDIWSVGVMVFIMLGGYYPFRGKSEVEVLKNVRYGQFKFKEKFWKDISKDAKDLIKRMLVVDPDDRITAAEVLASSWIGADIKILSADLSENMKEFKTEVTAKQKLKGVVKALIATQLLQTIAEQRED